MKCSSPGVYLDGRFYGLVKDYPFEEVEKKGPDALQKAVAYRYVKEYKIGDEILRAAYMLPYRGIIEPNTPRRNLPIGIYFIRKGRKRYKEYISRPRTLKEKEAYALGQEKDIMFAIMNGEYNVDEFADNQLNMMDIGTDTYMPPIHSNDDPLNMLVKLAIRLMCAPFGPYGKRMEALAINKLKGSEGANIRNNLKRALWLNANMTPNKACLCMEIFQKELGLVIRDKPGCMHPMHTNGKMIAIFPTGPRFEIHDEDILDATDLITQAICDSSIDDEREAAKKKNKDKEK